MSLDIEDLRIDSIKMPNITVSHTIEQVKKIDNIINKLNMDLSLDPNKLMKEERYSFSLIKLLHRYHQLVSEGKLVENEALEFKLMRKKGRGHSGVEVIAVSTYPEGKYVGCPADCYYCPKEPEANFNIRVISCDENCRFLLITVEHINEKDYFYTKVINKIFWDNKEIQVVQSLSVKKVVILKMDKSKFISYPKNGDVIQVHKTAQPRSYLSSEPAVSRANQNGWDCVAQFRDIAGKRIICGHNLTKVEGIVIGGTWSYYPKEYQINFIRDFYYAANTLYSDLPLRSKKSLNDEININQSTRCRVIGLTLETRPDFINEKEIIQLRKFGCTRVQLGIQHINNNILKYINRGCNHSKSVKAIKLLKDACFKVDIHLMPDLPGSNFWEDVRMLEHVLNHEELQADQWKIYPCQTMEHSKIKEWYDEGKYKPYFETVKVINFDNIYIDEIYKQTKYIYNPCFLLTMFLIWLSIFSCNIYILYLNIIPLGIMVSRLILEIYANKYISNPLFHLLIHFIPKVHPWIRLNRIVRDNPKHKIVGGLDQSHYRNIIEDRLNETCNKSVDIREREIKGRKFDEDNVKLITRSYQGSGSTEYFISFEDTKNNYILGFLRLRLPSKTNKHYLPELNKSALIREVHVYGWMVPQGNKSNLVQHRGYGKKLVIEAERIAINNGYNKISIISGVGVREYYKNKLNYKLEGTFMTKLF